GALVGEDGPHDLVPGNHPVPALRALPAPTGVIVDLRRGPGEAADLTQRERDEFSRHPYALHDPHFLVLLPFRLNLPFFGTFFTLRFRLFLAFLNSLRKASMSFRIWSNPTFELLLATPQERLSYRPHVVHRLPRLRHVPFTFEHVGRSPRPHQ